MKTGGLNWEKIEALNPSPDFEHFPRVTIIIPTCNDAKKIGITMENLIAQNYPDFEILIVDAASRDRTLEIVQSFRDQRIRLSSVSNFNRYEMMNKGIIIARGTYINFLFPGDYYLNKNTLQIMMQFAFSKKWASLVYCGCLIRDAITEPKILFRDLNPEQLKAGKQPTSLQSCWFHKNVFSTVGKFDPDYTLRGGFDFLCRFTLRERLSFFGINRVLIDYDLRDVTREMVVRHGIETAKILYKNFGFMTMLKWLKSQKDFSRYLRFSLRSMKKALVGR